MVKLKKVINTEEIPHYNKLKNLIDIILYINKTGYTKMRILLLKLGHKK